MITTDIDPFAWHSLLPEHLREPAYLFDNEYAWPRDLALEAIATLEQQGQHILGVDTWIPTRPNPTMVVYDWDEGAHLHNPAFTRTPSEFVKSFTWELGGVQQRNLPPYFNLTVE